MPKPFYQFQNNQMIMKFTDLEGDLPFLKRSLALYKKAYEEKYKITLKDEDNYFTITQDKNGKSYIKYPENVICVNVGDLTDKSRSNTGRTEAYNLELVEIFNNTHKNNGDRMISIIGNRETTKLRLNEIDTAFIRRALRQDLDLSAEDRLKTGAARDPKLVWVDGPAKTFLTYIQSLPEFKDLNDKDLWKKFIQINANNPKQIEIYYAKWMLANSCGAPGIWDELAIESKTQNNDVDTLKTLRSFYDKNGSYASYLSHCQLGAQVGNILFTHGGLEDNSFMLPKSLLTILSEAEVNSVLEGKKLSELTRKDGRLIADNIQQLLAVSNLWYDRIIELQFDNPKKINLHKARSELIEMGLPRQRHNGASFININIADKNGAYGNPLNEESHNKLKNSDLDKNVFILDHGHLPAEQERIGVDGDLLHIDTDTCNYRKGEAAVATTYYKENDLIYVDLQRIDQKNNHHHVSLTARTRDGKLVGGYGLHNPLSFIGQQIKLSETDKGWNIVNYKPEEDSFELFKQNGPPTFSPELKTVSAFTIYQLPEISKLLSPADSAEVQKQAANKTEQIIARAEKAIQELEEVNKRIENETNTALNKIDTILAALEKDSKEIPHHLTDAQMSMDRLIANLKYARSCYEYNIKDSGIDNANVLFINQCDSYIKLATPNLEKELGWGQYLGNLLKMLGNAVIAVGNSMSSTKSSFFTLDKSQSQEVIEKARGELKNASNLK